MLNNNLPVYTFQPELLISKYLTHPAINSVKCVQIVYTK